MFDVKKILNIVWSAGDIINKMYVDGRVNARTKADLTPLTDADIASHNYICSGLSRQFDYPIISEEAEVSYDVRRGWREFWLIDPLDGTQEFIARTGEFTINVAFIQDGSPVLGIIHAPALNETYYAVKGTGAYEVQGGCVLQLPLNKNANKIAVTSRFNHDSRVTVFAHANGVVEMQTVGASLKFGRLARGDVSLYPRYSGSKEWDIAAGHILLNEAGGTIVDLASTKEIFYNKPNMCNGAFVAVGDVTMIDTMKFI